MPITSRSLPRGRGAAPSLVLLAAVLAAVSPPVLAAGPLPAAADAQTPGASAPGREPGTLAGRVVLIAGDLSLRPVPKQRFLVVPAAGEQEPVSVTTAFDGTWKLALPPGIYRIRSGSAVEFEARRFSWDVEVEVRSGETVTLELSNDNARVEPLGTAGVKPQDLDAGMLYERFKGSVFKIIVDGGHGSGFLVSPDGLILTNHHVIADATYLAAKIDDRQKYQVSVLAQEAGHDLAVLRIHPDVVRDRVVIPLAEDGLKPAAVSVGERVVAIGSPLTTETILTEGVVSKVQPDTLTSDVNINPGNSGGPLLNRHGQAVGVCTYAMGEGGGPGLSGITRVHLAGAALSAAKEAMKGSGPPPSRPLPVESAYRFTPGTVREMALARPREAKDYHLEMGKVDVQIFTPVSVVSGFLEQEQEAAKARQKRKKGKGDAATEEAAESGQRYYSWQKDESIFLPVVRIRAFPEVKMTAGSMFAVGLLGVGGKYRFKTDFERMELRRGNEVIEPILPGRIKEVVNIQSGGGSMQDIGYWGLYEYPPEAFRAGAPLTLTVWEQGISEPRVTPIPEDLLQKLREDYRPYLETAAPAPPDGK